MSEDVDGLQFVQDDAIESQIWIRHLLETAAT